MKNMNETDFAIQRKSGTKNALADDYLEKLEALRKKFIVCSPYLSTLSDPVRQKILLILAESGIDGMDVQDITAKTHLSRPAISHHLKILKDAGMIISHKKGTQVYYFIYIQNALESLEDLITTVQKIVSNIDMETVKQNAPWMLNDSI